MRVVLSGGGTAGHINPALAVAEELQNRGVEVLYAGTPKGVESRLVPAAGLPFNAFDAMGFNRSHPMTLPKALLKIMKSTGMAKKWFKSIKPDVVVGFGGYVCIPVGRAAIAMGIPVVVHEQNSVMGMANKFLAKNAASVCLTYEHAAKDVPVEAKDRVVVSGNPTRSSFFQATKEGGRRALDIPQDARMLLVTGGSLGARHLNQALVALKDELLAYPDLYIMQITGPKEYDSVAASLDLTEDEAKRWRFLGYTNQMDQAMAAADAIVSRAGASSLAEISARALPALLVPFPYATEDHQTTNARACVDAGAAFMVADKDVEGPEFAAYLRRLIEEPETRAAMSSAANAELTRAAASIVADRIMAAARS